MCPTISGHQDGYYNNFLYQAKDGNYGNPAGCSSFGQGPNATIVFNNTVWTPTGAVTECGTTLAQYQSKGGDPMTTASAYPQDSLVLSIARTLMGL